MKYKEFEERIKTWGEKHGYETEVEIKCIEWGDSYIYVKRKSGEVFKKIAVIETDLTWVLDTDWSSFTDIEEDARVELLSIILKLAKTPIEERKDEKRYKFRHKYLGGRNSNYLTYDTVGGNWILWYDIGRYDFKGEFTIEELKEKFNSNLDDWEIIEVEE